MSRKPINVVISFPERSIGHFNLSEEARNKIKKVSGRISLHDVADLVTAEKNEDRDTQKRLDAILQDAEVFYGFGHPKDLMSRAPKLKWIQVPLAGVDPFLTPEMISSDVIVTKARIHERQISETIFTFILMLARKN